MLNVVAIIGRLTRDPEVKSTQNGVAFCSFTVACERSYTKAGEERKVDFIKVIAWRQTAEFIARYFSKGSMIAVNGELQVEGYTDKDGNKRNDYRVVASNVSFCGPKQSSNAEASGYEADAGYNDSGYEADETDEEDDDDIPF